MAFPQVVSVPEISSILRVLGMNHLSSIHILRLSYLSFDVYCARYFEGQINRK